MNVLSRKMFQKKRSRPARDALNKAGGIMSSSPELMNTVQMFNPGGPVKPGENVRIPGMAEGRGISGADVKNFLDYIGMDDFINYLGLRKPKSRTPTGYLLGEDPAKRLETISKKLSETSFIPAVTKKAFPYVGIATAGTPVNEDEQTVLDELRKKYGVNLEKAPQSIFTGQENTAEGVAPEMQGLAIEDIGAEIEAQKIAKEVKQLEVDSGNPTSLTNIEDAADIDVRKRAEEAAQREKLSNLMTTQEASFDQPESGKTFEDIAREDTEAQATADRLREESFTQPGKSMAESGMQIAKGLENKDKASLDTQLKDLMAQFTSNAPKYEGLDKGMALMKIGFAMAAGKSPYAMQNIAGALSGGADMFIKDKAKRDEFNRQVKLSALQYGLGEIGKEKAQQRADVRNIKDYVVGKGGLTMPDGTKLEEGRTVSLNMEQALSLGSKLSNLSSVAAFSTRQAAMTKALTAQLKLIEAQQGKGVKYSDFKSNIEDYGKSLNSAKEAEIARVFINDALLTVAEGEVTTLSAAGKELIRKGGAIFGFDVGEEFKDISTLNRKMNLALNKIIPLVIGDTQSANSISDRDVGFVIQAFLDRGIIAREGGAFKFLGASDDAIATGLQSALVEVNKSQQEDLRLMLSIEDNFNNVMVQGIGKTGTGMLTREISERKQLTGGGGLYYYNPESQTIGFAK